MKETHEYVSELLTSTEQMKGRTVLGVSLTQRKIAISFIDRAVIVLEITEEYDGEPDALEVAYSRLYYEGVSDKESHLFWPEELLNLGLVSPAEYIEEAEKRQEEERAKSKRRRHREYQVLKREFDPE